MRIFVSYAGQDRAWAEWVAWQLEHAGWDLVVELDYWDWQAGENFVARMNTALESCDHMLALFSKAYFEPARWTREEWTAAFQQAKERPGFLVPVRVDDGHAPPLLGPLNAPALYGRSREQARAELLRSIRPAGRPGREPHFPGQSNEERNDGPRLPGVLPAVWGKVPIRNRVFTGRDALLVRLREGLQDTTRSVLHALHGAGGVGKTQLATEYVWRFAGDYDAVWWVNAEQVDRIGEQFAEFAVAWGLVDPATPADHAIEVLRDYCRGRGRWLIVLDNAISAIEIAEWLLPGPGHALVTSRDPHWPEIATTVAVDVFTRTESLALLRAHLPSLPENQTQELADSAGDLPLALAQAGGFIAQSRIPTRDYLELLDETPGEVLDQKSITSYPRSLARTIRVSIAHLNAANPAAAQLLSLCAFLAPEPIPTSWFADADAAVLPEPLASAAASRLTYRKLLALLSSYSLISFTADEKFTVHRLTQRLLRADAIDANEIAETAGTLIAGLKPGDPRDPDTWPAWSDLLPHLQALDLAGLMDPLLASQACNASFFLLRRGDPGSSLTMIRPLYRAWMERLGLDAPQTRWAADYLGRSLRAIGRLTDAEAIDRDLYNGYLAELGADHPDTLNIAINLAYDLRLLGRYEEARDLNKATLGRRIRLFGKDDPQTLITASNLASDLTALGEYQEAREVYEDTLARRRRVLTPDHPDSLWSAYLLERILRRLGEDNLAHRLSFATFKGRRKTLGDDHPDTLTSAHEFAIDLWSLGRCTFACILAERTLEGRRTTLGHADPHTQETARIVTKMRELLGKAATTRS